MRKLFTILLILCLSVGFSQKRPFKFGKVSNADFELESCEFYPDAKSVILGKFGDLRFLYNDTKGWQYKLEAVVRIKVFDITDAEQGNVKLQLFDPVKGENREELTIVRTITYNKVGKEIKKDRINNAEVFEKRINDYWVQKSFAVPNVSEGTVFEYSYSIVSDYISNLTEWTFQEDIPSYYSEFECEIPEYFSYQSSFLGNSYNLTTSEAKETETFNYTYSTLDDGMYSESPIASGSTNKRSSFTTPSKRTKMVMTTIPPVESEPFQTNRSDLPGRVEFQLVSTNFPSRGLRLIANNYEKFNRELVNSEDFGKVLEKGEYIGAKISGLQGLSALEKARKIYYYHTNSLAWDGFNSLTSKKTGKMLLDEGEGSAAEINLSLVSVLRHHGIEAYPIALSTRNHGLIHPVYPSFADFNYVIALASIEGETYFLDASTDYPFGLIPLKCRNGNAWMMTESGGQMVNMMTSSNQRVSTTNKCEVVDGMLQISTQRTFSDYGAISHQKKDSTEVLQNFIEELTEDEMNVKDVQIGKNEMGRMIEFKYESAEEVSDEYFFQPIKGGTIMENPFKRETRNSVIDFPYKQSWRVVTQINIPEGYTVELPKPARVNLPDKKGSFSYLVTQNGNTVIVNSSARINATSFGIDEYPQIRQFYQMVADKNNELIVLSR